LHNRQYNRKPRRCALQNVEISGSDPAYFLCDPRLFGKYLTDKVLFVYNINNSPYGKNIDWEK
jgi:hypothetical protein